MQTISTITPVYNGSQFLPELINQLHNLKNEIENRHDNVRFLESIFVVDEAIDNSLQVLNEIAKQYKWIHVIQLSKNYGQHPATIAGIMHSSGDWVFTLDEDIQHPPSHLPRILQETLQNECDICYAHSKESIHKSFLRDTVSMSFKKLVALLSGNKNVGKFSSFRCIRGSIARAAAATCSADTYFDISLSWFSNRICTTTLNLVDQRNQDGNAKSGYSIWGLIRHAKRLILSSKLKFLRLITMLGILSFLLSIIYSIFVLSKIAMGHEVAVQGWTSTIISIYFFGGLTCLFLGIILESLSEILLKTKGKPTFFVVDRSRDAELLASLRSQE